MAAKDKDTIYIDIDDEITGIIDKVRSSDGKVVALVLPKRASAFQSIVNMKLLKRAVDNSGKHLVLITSEAGLLPLAGAAGVHVAKTLTSKPEIPAAPDHHEEAEETIQEMGDEEPDIDATKPVGQLAGAKTGADGIETLTLDDADLPPELDKPKGAKDFTPAGGKKNKNGKKKLAVPNFQRFRLLLIAGGLALILLISGLVFALTSMPRATISVKTDATAVDANVGITLSTTAKDLDTEEAVLPAKQVQQQKTYTQQVPTTGQKNNGNKASGSVVFYNCNKGDVLEGQDRTIPAGTGISNNNQTYITQQTVTIPPSNFSGDNCRNNRPSEPVTVMAQSGGASYNVPANSTFSVSYSNPGGSFNAKASGAISGGTDNIVKTVNQNDINNAKAKIDANSDDVKKTLKDQLSKEKLFAVEATFAAGTPNTATSAGVGAVADTVTVTEVITYTMFGVDKDDLTTLVEDSIKDQIDTEKQTIIDNGLDKAVYNVENLSANGGKISVATVASAGPDIDVEGIKQLAAGKKPGDIKSELESNPDVISVDVKLGPFWVSSVPKKTDKIKVEIAKPEKKAEASAN